MILVGVVYGEALTDTRPAYFAYEARSLRIAVNGNDLAAPVMVAGTADVLEVSFDLLGDDYRYLRYDITHCDARWQPSHIMESEYLEGFNIADVRQYRKSSATTVPYYHYSIEIPNEDIRLKLSGNYLLRVYDEADTDTPLLQCRFMVTEQSVGIMAEISTLTDVSHNDRMQQLKVEVDGGRDLGADMMNDIVLTISQNGREDNRVYIDRPSFISGSKAVYDHRKELIFAGGNEYRRFETVSTEFLPLHVAEIGFRRPYYHFLLSTDYPKIGDEYEFALTPKGRYRVSEFNSADPDIEADYSGVRFLLDPVNAPGGDVYLDGDMTLHRIDESSRMEFDQTTGCYEKVLLLKQGSYSYQYIVPDHPGNIIEGDHHQTQNEYFVAVYLHSPGSRYDRLIATALLTM